ncbi:MAG TPA: hypothetical protein PLX66_02600 [Bacilli bacterium]|nr:hypothetical protein [Bacilli bacterium]
MSNCKKGRIVDEKECSINCLIGILTCCQPHDLGLSVENAYDKLCYLIKTMAREIAVEMIDETNYGMANNIPAINDDFVYELMDCLNVGMLIACAVKYAGEYDPENYIRTGIRLMFREYIQDYKVLPVNRRSVFSNNTSDGDEDPTAQAAIAFLDGDSAYQSKILHIARKEYVPDELGKYLG